MSIFEILAEQRITEAVRRGDFDDLPGAGKPLDLSEEFFVSGEQRMINRVLKNAGYAPPEVLLRREIAQARAEIAALPEGERRTLLRRRLAHLVIRLGETRARI